MNQEYIWDKLAEQWRNFRQLKFKPVYKFIKRYNPKKGKILEMGCGNARNLIPFAREGFECYGIDFSKNMLIYAKKLAIKKKIKVNLKKADLIRLPYKKNSFNYILYVSSLHHLKTPEKRLASLEEAYRTLKPKGLMLLTVWNKLQPRFLFKKKDIFVPWKKEDKIYKRYYHLFTCFELKKLIKKTRFKVISSNIFGDNLVFTLKK